MSRLFSSFAAAIARATGKPLTFELSVVLIIIGALCGPAFRFSDTWQLVINTGTTIVTFLMVFLIQNTQNRDGAAIQAKLPIWLEEVRPAPGRDPRAGSGRFLHPFPVELT
jgi:low affinity Fe/Cu permease